MPETMPDPDRSAVLALLSAGAVKNPEAAALLDISIRQLQRLKVAHASQGTAAFTHGNSGRRPRHAVSSDMVDQVVRLATSGHQVLNQTQFASFVQAQTLLSLSRVTIHRILKNANVAMSTLRGHRSVQGRSPRVGMMVRIDTARRDWRPPGLSPLSLVAIMDDATGRVLGASLRQHADEGGFFAAMRQLVDGYGIPAAIVTSGSAYLGLGGQEPWGTRVGDVVSLPATQFAQLMRRLGVHYLERSSTMRGPSASAWAIFVSGLSDELSASDVTEPDQANRLLAAYVDRHNLEFCSPPTESEAGWLPWPEGLDLDECFALQYHRELRDDSIFRLNSKTFRVCDRGAPLPEGSVVEVLQTLANETRACYNGARLTVELVEERRSRRDPNPSSDNGHSLALPKSLGGQVGRGLVGSPADHVWKRYAAAGVSLKKARVALEATEGSLPDQ